MEFRIQDVARVHKASIKLEGITVLAGPNGSGKSTISRALVTLGALTTSLEARIRIERLRSLAALLSRSEWQHIRSPFRWFSWDGLSKEEQTKWLDFSFSGVADCVYDWCKERAEEFSFWGRRFGFEKKDLTYREYFIENYNRSIPEIEKIITRPDEEYEAFVITKAFQRSFCSQLNAKCPTAVKRAVLVLTMEEREVQTIVEQEKCVEHTGFADGLSVRFCYLEPAHLLDRVTFSNGMLWREGSSRYGLGVVDWGVVLEQEAPGEGQTLEDAKALDETQVLLKEICKTIHGRLAMTERRLAFRDEDVGCAIELPNVASGAKSMAMIIRALETGNLTANSVLVIDEPETNLHPAWLVRFAEFLVLIAKHLKIKILLNTHNPFFMMALEKFTRREGLWEVLRVYQMVSAENEAGEETPMFEAQEVTGNHEVFYDALAIPLDELRVL